MIWYPKDQAENWIARRYAIGRCRESVDYAASEREKCRLDALYWLNMWGWTCDPRKMGSKEFRDLPFITYPFQDDALLEMEERLGKKDVVLPKSRDVGATWIILGLFTHRWLFRPSMSFGLVSREATLVDGVSNSLFGRVRYMVEKQPLWLLPGVKQTEPKGVYGYFTKENYIINLKNRSTMEGATTTPDMFRQNRYTAILWDEMAAGEMKVMEGADAATFRATNCRIMPSTPQGASGPFYRVAHNKHIKRIELPWWKHPVYSVGLVSDHKHPNANKQGYWSPWYQGERDRMEGVPALIAQELDLDFVGSGNPFFDIALLERLLAKCEDPYQAGYIAEDEQKPGRYRFEEKSGAPLYLWCWTRDGELPAGRYYGIGVDLSWGVTRTNSVASIIDLATGEKVGEYASSSLSPDLFAQEVYRIAKFFHNAYVIWETNGPGANFGKKLIELGHLNVYYRRNEQSIEWKEKPVPGWPATVQNQFVLFGQYAAGLASGKFKNPCAESLKEAKHYQFLAGNKVGNPHVHTTTDRAGATVLHGDRVTADALAYKAFQDQGVKEPVATEENYQPNREHYDFRTFIGRRLMSQMATEDAQYW